MEEKKISRQRKWQIEQVEKGKCYLCGENIEIGLRCKKHGEKWRIYARNRYRIKHNIPLDAPLSKRGRPRKTLDNNAE